MNVSIISGTRVWNRDELRDEEGVQAILLLVEGRCVMAKRSMAAPMAVSLAKGDPDHARFENARAVIFTFRGKGVGEVIPDSLTLQIASETFFKNSFSAAHQQAAALAVDKVCVKVYGTYLSRIDTREQQQRKGQCREHQELQL